LAESATAQPIEQAEESYIDPEVKAQNDRLDALEANTREAKVAQDEIDFNNNINIVNNSLLEQGISGFDTIGKDIVDSKLRTMYKDDPLLAQAHDTPEGWAKIYIEALPALQKIGQTRHKSDLFNKKPLDNAQPKKKKTPEQEYMESRSANQI